MNEQPAPSMFVDPQTRSWLESLGIDPNRYRNSPTLTHEQLAVHQEAWELAKAESNVFNGQADACSEANDLDELREAMAGLPDEADRLAFVRSIAYRHRAQALNKDEKAPTSLVEKLECGTLEECVEVIAELGQEYAVAFIEELIDYRKTISRTRGPALTSEPSSLALGDSGAPRMLSAEVKLSPEAQAAEDDFIEHLARARKAESSNEAIAILLEADAQLDHKELRGRVDLKDRLDRTSDLIQLKWSE